MFEKHYNTLPLTYSSKTNLPVIGNKILDFFAVTLDLKNRTLYLKEYADMDAYRFRSLGFDVELKNGRVQVSRLIQDSAAQQAGIQLGDEVRAINDQPAEYKDYCTFQRAMLAHFRHDRIVLALKSGDSEKRVTLTKQPFSD